MSATRRATEQGFVLDAVFKGKEIVGWKEDSFCFFEMELIAMMQF